jgi:uncharacterized protein (TIGR02145 family)
VRNYKKLLLVFGLVSVLSACFSESPTKKDTTPKLCTNNANYVEPFYPVFEDLPTITDERDGQVYKYTVIGTQTWLAEDMNYVPEGFTSYCYFDEDSNCDTFGRLYPWFSAMMSYDPPQTGHHQGVCPEGWHIPSDAEFREMESATGFCEDWIDEFDQGLFSGLKSDYTLTLLLDEDWAWEYTGGKNPYGLSLVGGGGYTVEEYRTGNWLRRYGQYLNRTFDYKNGRIYFINRLISSGTSFQPSNIQATGSGAGYAVRCIKDD